MSECKHENLLRVDKNQLWCPDCDGKFTLLQYSVNYSVSKDEEVKPVAKQSRLEILQEFYEACRAACAHTDTEFGFTKVGFSYRLFDLLKACYEKFNACIEDERKTQVVTKATPKFEALFRFYKTILAGNSDDDCFSIFQYASTALDECTRELEEIEARDARTEDAARYSCDGENYRFVWRELAGECVGENIIIETCNEASIGGAKEKACFLRKCDENYLYFSLMKYPGTSLFRIQKEDIKNIWVKEETGNNAK